VVWAVGDADERHAVEQAQDSAASTLVDYMRRHCPLVRDHGEPQLAKDILAIAVNHHTSRQTEAQAERGTTPDPQLHTQLLWLMAERDDGRLGAVYRDGIWKNRIEWEAAYHCALATELARAGFPIRRMTGNGGRYFEIDVFAGQLCRRPLLAAPSSLVAAQLVGQPANGDRDQPAARVLGDSLLGPLERRREQGLLDGVLSQVEVAVAANE